MIPMDKNEQEINLKPQIVDHTKSYFVREPNSGSSCPATALTVQLFDKDWAVGLSNYSIAKANPSTTDLAVFPHKVFLRPALVLVWVRVQEQSNHEISMSTTTTS
uniref:SFRICE_013732 n=1 Tax=Spodoptera frugiperda TaxID=7108 RepID=A0A2H1VFP1_SPOFR